MTSASADACSAYKPTAEPKLHARPSAKSAHPVESSPIIVRRRAPNRSASLPKIGCSVVVATAATPKSRPIRAGPTPSALSRCRARIGSIIEIVADAVTTAAAQVATSGVRTTAAIGTCSRASRWSGRSSQANATAPNAASTATTMKGRRTPPSS